MSRHKGVVLKRSCLSSSDVCGGAVVKKYMLFVISVALVLSSSMRGQEIKATLESESDRAHLDELRREGFNKLYNLEYEEARKHFREMARLFPAHPAGAQFLATSLWLQTLGDSRRLQTSLYNSDAFYEETDDKVDPRVVNQFREWTRQAKTLADVRLRQNPKDAEALYFSGAIDGLKAAFAGSVERSFIPALRAGARAVDRHREVVKVDSAYADAELTIGLYDYIVGDLPLPVKLLASVGGVRGSKRRGLQTLERVAKEGRWAGDDARTILIALYKREGRWTDALNVSSELSAKYERNYIFKLEAADALTSLAASERKANNREAATKHEAEAFTIFERLLGRERAGRESASRTSARPAFDLIHFRYGEVLLAANQFARAAKEFKAAANVSGAEAGLATMAHLRRAQTLDLAGDRGEAIAAYKTVLTRPNIYDAHKQAARRLQEPFRR